MAQQYIRFIEIIYFQTTKIYVGGLRVLWVTVSQSRVLMVLNIISAAHVGDIAICTYWYFVQKKMHKQLNSAKRSRQARKI